jgi:DNA-3-methyladenine glycosylase I
VGLLRTASPDQRRSGKQVPAETELSRAISKDLAARGFKFCGPTIVYAFMQAVGMVNDHLVSCHRHAAQSSAMEKLRTSLFRVPEL